MKKAIAVLAVMAVISGTAGLYAPPVKALETVGMEDYQQQNSAEMPDLGTPLQEVTENNLVFQVYDTFAYLTDCRDTTLTEVVIPAEVEGVPVIGIDGAVFGYCRNLTTIVLPDTMQYFAWIDLVSCTVRAGSDEAPLPSVSSVIVSENNPYYTVQDGLLYSKDLKTLIGCPPAMGMQEVTLSPETDTIGDYAFAGCTALEAAVLPSHVAHICNGAFAGCPALVKAELPEQITSVSADMFAMCTALSDITFRGAVEKIGMGAFQGCTALKDFTIPETVTFIGRDAFLDAGCTENVNGVHYVQNWAVGSEETIVNAVLRDGTIGVAETAFLWNNDLALLDIPATAEYTDHAILAIMGSCPLTLHCRNASMGEKTLKFCKSAADIYIYDPDCEIFDSENTIPAAYQYYVEATVDGIYSQTKITGETVIHGYAGSTAQAYAEKYGRQFAVIEGEGASGDVSGDGIFSVADAVLLQKWLLGVPDTALTDWQAADLCADGSLDAFDLACMKRALLAGE